MYQLRFTDPSGAAVLLYDPRLPHHHIREATCSQTINEAGLLTFTVDYAHEAYDVLTVRPGRVDLLELAETGTRTVFSGRIVSVAVDEYRSKTVEVEGLLGLFADSIIKPFSFPEAFPGAASAANVVEFFLGWLIDQHNDQTLPWQHLTLGRVTVSDPNNYITRSSESYATTADTLRDKFFDSSLGGFLLLRQEASVGTVRNYVDYLAELPEDTTQSITLGGNLLSLLTTLDAREAYSQILPIGADGLTIEALPDSTLAPGYIKRGPLIRSQQLAESLGNVTRLMTWDQVTIASNLQSRALAELQAAALAPSVEVSALDLHQDGGSFKFGTRIRVRSDPHGINALYPISELTINLLDPAGTMLTLGALAQTITAASAAALRPQISEA